MNSSRVVLSNLSKESLAVGIGGSEILKYRGHGFIVCRQEGELDVLDIINAERYVFVEEQVVLKHSILNNSSKVGTSIHRNKGDGRVQVKGFKKK